jgi:hypothetical protein
VLLRKGGTALSRAPTLSAGRFLPPPFSDGCGFAFFALNAIELSRFKQST